MLWSNKIRPCLVILVSLLVTVFKAQIPTSGLIGAWPFTGNANDLSTSANHGTLVTATPTVDRCGNANSAYYFNGSTTQIRTSLNGPTGSAPRAISFWSKSTNTVANSPRSCFHYGTSVGAADTWQINWNYCAQGVGIDVSNQACIKGNMCVNNNAWHHIVISFNSALSAVYSSADVYIDGVLQPGLTCFTAGSNATVNTVAGGPITFGKDANFNTRYFIGCLDDFYFYNRALTPAEVLQLYNANPCMAPVVGNTLVCSGSTYAYSVAPYSNATYTWSLPGGWTGTSNSNTLSALAGTTGTILVTASSTCGLLPSFSLAVTAAVNPTIVISSTSNTLCSSQTATLSLTGATNYSWSTGALNSSIIVAPATTSVYTAVSQNTGGCNSVGSFTQYVAANPTLNISTNSISCNGQTATITAFGAANYTWLPANANGSVFTISPGGNYNYTVIGAVNSCTGSALGSLIVPPALSLSINTSTNSICLGNSILISANVSGGSGGYNYNWNPVISNTSAISVALANNGNYATTVTVSDANSCTISAAATVSFFTGAVISAPPIGICSNGSGIISATGASSYTWFPGNLVSPSITVFPPGPLAHTVIGTSASGCTASAVTSASIKPTPSLSFSTFTITCGNLGSATVVPSGGTGPFTYSWQPTSQTGSIATGLFPGVYTVTVDDNGTGCVFTPTTTFLPLVPMTGTVFGTFSNPCFGVASATAGISLSGGSGSQNYNWTSSNGSQSTAIGGPFSAGITTISVTDNLTFCNVTQTFAVTQPVAIAIGFSTTSNSVCLGSTIGATANVSGGTAGYTYTWSSAGNQSTTVLQELVSGIYVYSVSVTDANSCTNSGTLALNFVPNPTVTATSATICPQQQTTLVANGASTYVWNTGATSEFLIIAPATTTGYTVLGSALGCTASSLAHIDVKPAPTVTLTHNSPVCANVTLTCSVNGGIAYNWSGPNNFTSTLSTLVFGNSISTQSGMYSATVTGANSCTAQISQSLTVHPNPLASAAGATVCEGSTIFLAGNYLNGASYNWLGSSGSLGATQTLSFSNSNLSQTGTYTFVITAITGCSNTALATVSVTPAFSTAISGNTAYCSGESIQLSVLGGTQYFWNGPNGFFAASPSVSVVTTGTANSGVYQVTATTGPCKSISSTSVTIWPLPALNASITSPTCENGIAQLNASGAQTYTWQGPSATVLSRATTQLAPVQLFHAGIFTLSGTSVNGCKSTYTSQIQVLPAPPSVTKLFNVCIGSPVTLTIGGASSYQWQGPLNFVSQGTVCNITALQAAQAGTYQVTLTNTNNCKSISNLVVSAFSLPIPTVSISGNTVVCSSSSNLLSAHNGTDTHTWVLPNASIVNSDSLFLQPTGLPGKNTYTLISSAKNGCQKLDTISVLFLAPPPNKILSQKLSLCSPACNNFFIDATGLKDALFISETQTVQAFKTSLCAAQPGKQVFKAIITDTSNCKYTLNYSYETYETPIAEFYVSPAEPIAGNEPLKLYNASSGFFQSSWNWYIGAGNADTLYGQNQEYYFDKSGQKPIVLVVSNKFGCTDTVVKYLFVQDDFSVYMPNSFSPNGDGTNDHFFVYGTGIKTLELSIFNRWGELLFQTTNVNTGWDGSYNGSIAESSTYVYKLKVVSFSGVQKDLTGHIVLLR